MGPDGPGTHSGKLPEGSCYARSAVVPAQSQRRRDSCPSWVPELWTRMAGQGTLSFPCVVCFSLRAGLWKQADWVRSCSILTSLVFLVKGCNSPGKWEWVKWWWSYLVKWVSSLSKLTCGLCLEQLQQRVSPNTCKQQHFFFLQTAPCFSSGTSSPSPGQNCCCELLPFLVLQKNWTCWGLSWWQPGSTDHGKTFLELHWWEPGIYLSKWATWMAGASANQKGLGWCADLWEVGSWTESYEGSGV